MTTLLSFTTDELEAVFLLTHQWLHENEEVKISEASSVEMDTFLVHRKIKNALHKIDPARYYGP